MTLGSSFVRMVRGLNTTDITVSYKIGSYVSSLLAQMNAGLWLEGGLW